MIRNGFQFFFTLFSFLRFTCTPHIYIGTQHISKEDDDGNVTLYKRRARTRRVHHFPLFFFLLHLLESTIQFLLRCRFHTDSKDYLLTEKMKRGNDSLGTFFFSFLHLQNYTLSTLQSIHKTQQQKEESTTHTRHS